MRSCIHTREAAEPRKYLERAPAGMGGGVRTRGAEFAQHPLPWRPRPQSWLPASPDLPGGSPARFKMADTTRQKAIASASSRRHRRRRRRRRRRRCRFSTTERPHFEIRKTFLLLRIRSCGCPSQLHSLGDTVGHGAWGGLCHRVVSSRRGFVRELTSSAIDRGRPESGLLCPFRLLIPGVATFVYLSLCSVSLARVHAGEGGRGGGISRNINVTWV